MRFSDLLNQALLEIYESYVPVQEREELGLVAKDMTGTSFDWLK